MQWYHVEMRQDETLKVNGHLRSGSASEAVKIALGRERRWPVQEVGRDAARAIDPENPENWCKASGVKGPAWPSTKEAPEKKKVKKKAAAKVKAGKGVTATAKAAPVAAAKKGAAAPVKKGKAKPVDAVVTARQQKKTDQREAPPASRAPGKAARKPLKKSA